jgi:hypothetical protein
MQTSLVKEMNGALRKDGDPRRSSSWVLDVWNKDDNEWVTSSILTNAVTEAINIWRTLEPEDLPKWAARSDKGYWARAEALVGRAARNWLERN